LQDQSQTLRVCVQNSVKKPLRQREITVYAVPNKTLRVSLQNPKEPKKRDEQESRPLSVYFTLSILKKGGFVK